MIKIFYKVLLLSLLFGGCLGLGGCLNLKPKVDGVKLYALGPVESVDRVAVGATSIYISRPDLPVYLDGKRLQYRLSNGEVGELSHARWAEPLEAGVARSLAEYLQSTSPRGVSGFYPWPKRTRESAELRVHFYKLGALENGDIRMVADWELHQTDRLIASGMYQSTGIVWAVGNPTSLVGGLNEALQQLAAEVAESL